ncbi:hypothetical protein NMY22_g6890 [Coprinellus aureogranulatus]|nr:hypothetical protein NMY22_g6890 [Coprinellus aureogranulatus]
MEPCRTTVKVSRRNLGPFSVIPFLYYYETDELSRFMRAHLDPPFNERFSKFIEIVKMRGTDYVRMSKKDLERLCDGEGDYLYDLETLQKALHRPKSPPLRKVFSLPPMDGTFPQPAPDLFGDSPSEVDFDYPDEDPLHPVFECIIPLPTTPPPVKPVELPPAEEVTIPFSPTSSATDHEDDDSLIVMFSPVPSLTSRVLDDDSSDTALSPTSTDPDVFDEEHLTSLCSTASSPVYDDDEVIDILGLLSQVPSSIEDIDSPTHPPVLDSTDLHYSDELEEDDVISLSSSAEHSPQTHLSSSLPPTPGVAVARVSCPELLLQAAKYSPSSKEASELVIVEDGVEVIPAHDSPADCRDVLLHAASAVGTPPHSTLSSPLIAPVADPVSQSIYGDDHHEVDIDDLRTGGDGVGLSSFMPDLRSLDSSPPPLSPRLDPTSECDEVSLAFSNSPDLTSIHTPTIAVFHDDALVASPSASYRNTHDHLPEFYYNPDRIVDKKLELTLPSDPSIAEPLSETTTTHATGRPVLEVTIPILPSLLEDEQLTSLMSSVELTKLKSRGWEPSLTPSSSTFALSRSSSMGSDRSIWPVRSMVGRHLLSPHMKEAPPPPMRESYSSPADKVPTSTGEPESPLKHSAEVYTSHQEGTSSQRAVPPPASAWGKVGGFFCTILTPIELEENGPIERHGPSFPGGFSP